MLMAACAEAGVSLGAFDRRIMAWLSGFEPSTAAVVCGVITRAHEAGKAASADLLERARDVLLDDGLVMLTAAQFELVLGALADAQTLRARHLDDARAAAKHGDLATQLCAEEDR